MRVVGLDVCKNAVVACILDCDARPPEPRQLYYDLDFPKFTASAAGLKELLELKPDVAVLEPTGVNYSKLWVTHLAAAGVEVVLVGHRQLRSYRVNLDLPDKDDQADALALACYYFDHHQSVRRFARLRDPIVSQMRECVFRLHHVNRVQSPIINRLRQDLAWQFPEAASIGLNAPLFWGWLSGERKSAKYDQASKSSIGLGLEVETRNNAHLLWQLMQQEQRLELKLRNFLSDVRFLPYRQTFKKFGFGDRTEALIISQIYPLENYMGDDGKPEVKIRKGKLSGQPTKRHLSLRRFQKALGTAPSREESGDTRRTKKAGSSVCRIAMWQWVFTRIEVKRSRPKSAIAQTLSEMYDREKKSKPIKLVRSRVAAKASVLLFRELVKTLNLELQ